MSTITVNRNNSDTTLVNAITSALDLNLAGAQAAETMVHFGRPDDDHATISIRCEWLVTTAQAQAILDACEVSG